MNQPHRDLLIGLRQKAGDLRKEYPSLFGFEYFDGSCQFVLSEKLAELVLGTHADGYPQAEEIANKIRDFMIGDEDVKVVDDPDGCLDYVINDYDTDGDTPLDCHTVMLLEDGFEWCALTEYDSMTIKSNIIPLETLMRLAETPDHVAIPEQEQ